ncbi:hypothetical protein NUU61_008704 [Penicillium alfredii]|uniref:DUF7582 domain-containing protein n=1 Tax=Penicillium alfredii TaxID=1506179 RepID=A0A9W9ELV6_9EURO|nr:uncharacterized protein NUU61_008704 [Penicillium alfredii]KAJ5084125.1 hypothetical protein NUU61_008704 [Penicillium alfredii]
MGVMRLPRPTGIYVPNSPTRSLTNDMISPPLSPEFTFDADTVIPSIMPALEYISSKLQQRMMHVTLLVGRGKPFPTGQASDLMIIPITPLDPASWRVLERAISKSAKKFSLGQSWTDALNRSQYERQANEYLVQQSILQNEVVFSQEGLTLLNMDRIYTFKRRLCILSNRPFSRSDGQSMTSCVQLLHRLIVDFQGRPFSKAFFHRVYEQLDVSDELLTAVATAYKNVHKQEAIILPPRAKAEHSRKSPIRSARVRRQPPPAKSSVAVKSGVPVKAGVPAKRGPKTPLSASDVTPITRNEWNILVSQDIRQLQPTVTKWTPSPTVLAVA